MQKYTVEYYAGTYKGKREVYADDEEQAIAKVKTWVKRQMSEPMYADGYKIIDND